MNLSDWYSFTLKKGGKNQDKIILRMIAREGRPGEEKGGYFLDLSN